MFNGPKDIYLRKANYPGSAVDGVGIRDVEPSSSVCSHLKDLRAFFQLSFNVSFP